MAKVPDRLANALDFERPIAELDHQIASLEEFGGDAPSVEILTGIEALRREREKLLHKVFGSLTSWQRVRLARHPLRPVTSDYVDLIFDDVVELYGDRLYKDDRAIFTAFARLGEKRVLLVAHRKGKTTQERMATYWGCAHPEGYRKALHKMKIAEKFGVPIVTLIDTPGAYPGIGAEERGQAAAIARNLVEMSRLRVPVVSCVIGEGGSGGALGIGVCDRLLMLEYSYYSVISPEGCAAILWKDSKRAEEAAEALKITAEDLRGLGLVDDVVPEPLGGAHRDPVKTAIALRDALLRHLAELEGLAPDALLAARRERYRWIGDGEELRRRVLEALDREGLPEKQAGAAAGEKKREAESR